MFPSNTPGMDADDFSVGKLKNVVAIALFLRKQQIIL